MKVNDKFASTTRDILADAKSVKSKRSLEKIAGDRDDVWSGEAKATAKIARAEKSSFPAKFSPQLAVLAEHPPKGNSGCTRLSSMGIGCLRSSNPAK